MDQWVAKAEKALRTGQPKLAELYMRRGLSMSPGGRYWLQGHDLWVALGEFRDAFRRAFSPPVNMAVRALGGPGPEDYALAGPSKGVAP